MLLLSLYSVELHTYTNMWGDTLQDYARGSGPQLERGIAEALRLIEEYPTATPIPEQHPYRGHPKK